MPRNTIRLLRAGNDRAFARRAIFFLFTASGILFVALGVAFSSSAIPALSQAQFGDPAFQATWERTDGPVAAGTAQRGWIWGPVPGQTLSEPFNGLPGNTHLVQYFDKGRMEINDPNADKNSPFYVTNGLLALELISGQEQTGLTSYQYIGPATLNLASDMDDPTAPTYQSFNGVSNIPGAPNNRRAEPAIGQALRTAIDRLGRTQPWPSSQSDYGVKVAYFEPMTGHNIPDVFWDYLNRQGAILVGGKTVTGPLFSPWFSITGYPISEAYWAYVKVAGSYTDVLIQAYERRVLTFVPHFQVGFKVQMNNIGQHYYQWRYNNTAVSTPGPPATATPVPTPPVQLSDILYSKSVTDINGNQIRITNTGQAPLSFNGWWLDSPKWDHVDRFYFPPGITLAPGASLIAHSGLGFNSATDIYMNRVTVMWDGQPYDLAVLYENHGRQVAYLFPAGGTAQPPPTATPPTVPTATLPVPPGGATPTPTLVPGKTVIPDLTPTPTPGVPTPEPTSPAAVGTATPTP